MSRPPITDAAILSAADAVAAPAQPLAAPGEGRATIADVAARAGVSKATVSRFLNHRDTLLTRDIAAKVEVAIAELGYVPSPMARALKRGRSRLIGLVVADISNPFSVAVLRGAEQACQEAGYLVMLFNLGNDGARKREGIEALASYQVEGFILNTLGADAQAAGEVARHGKPAVLVDRRHPEMQADFVSLDNTDAMGQAVRHLLGAGYRALVYVTEPTAGVSSRLEREGAFRSHVAAQSASLAAASTATHGAAAGAAGLTAEVIESGEAQEAALLTRLTQARQRAGAAPLAIVASNAVTTLRVAGACAALGWPLGASAGTGQGPGVGFVGFDETEWAPLVGPGLTTIAQPTDDIGRVAAHCLLDHLQGRRLPPRQILLPGRLIMRGSSQAPSA